MVRIGGQILLKLKYISTAVLLSTLSATQVSAQALAEEIVLEYVSEMTESGLKVDLGQKTVSGSTVEWTNVVFHAPNDAGSFTMPFIRAEEIGGGQISMSYPPAIVLQMDAKDNQPEMTINVSFGDMKHIISGPSDARKHDMTTNALSYFVTSPEPKLTATFTIADLVSQYVNSGVDVRNSKGSIKAANAKLVYALDDPAAKMSMVTDYANLAIDFDVDLVSQENMAQLFSGARNMALTYSIGETTSMVDMDTPDANVIVEASTVGGGGTLGVQSGVLNFDGVGKAAQYKVMMKDLPLPPFEASLDASTVAVQMPLAQSDAPSDANIKFGFEGLKASDTVWGLIDPTGSLPRDKAMLNIDLTAQLKWLVDLTKIDGRQGMPAEVSSVTINDLSLAIAGASFNGTGAAVIDNSKFPPEPVGTANLDLKGGIGLLDKLVALGLVPEQQGQMVKMMSGIFAVPGGNGTDHLTSKIEMKEGGSILVNGQQVK